MKVLYLGNADDNSINYENKIIMYIKSRGIDVIILSTKITVEYIKSNDFDLIISYKYRYIICREIIMLGIPIINLHISYLPWNRGADPNLWSFIDNTKKGVTIHLIDENIDTGSILYQKELFINNQYGINNVSVLEETLETTYNILNTEIQNLFIENFNNIINKNYIPIMQNINEGTYHKSIDKNKIMDLLLNGWQTKIIDLHKIIHNN